MSHLHDHKDRGVAKNEQEFLDWVCQQDSEQEERQETPKHRHRPMEDYDKYQQFLPKGTQR